MQKGKVVKTEKERPFAVPEHKERKLAMINVRHFSVRSPSVDKESGLCEKYFIFIIRNKKQLS